MTDTTDLTPDVAHRPAPFARFTHTHTLAREVHARYERTLARCQESHQLLCQTNAPQPGVVGVPRTPAPPISLALALWEHEMNRAFRLCAETRVVLHHAAELRAEADHIHQETPDMNTTWLRPTLTLSKASAPLTPAEQMALDITASVLARYNWEPLHGERLWTVNDANRPRFHRGRPRTVTNADEQQSA